MNLRNLFTQFSFLSSGIALIQLASCDAGSSDPAPTYAGGPATVTGSGGAPAGSGGVGAPPVGTAGTGVVTTTGGVGPVVGTGGNAPVTGGGGPPGVVGTGGASGGGGPVVVPGAGAGGTPVVGTAGAPSTPVAVRPNGCAVKPGLLADFEEGVGMPPAVVVAEDRNGAWEKFDDKSGGTMTMAVEASGGTADCDKAALHVQGKGFTDWGAGFGFSLVGTPEMPSTYDAAAHNFTGISFKAKLGATHHAKAPVRFNISTPWSENKDNPGGECTPTEATDNKAALDCYQHVGKFLYRGTGTYDIGTEWKTFSFCFDRDLFPLSLPSNLTTEQRNTIATKILKVQFQPNQGKDYSVPYPAEGEYEAFTKDLPFDIWLDDLTFFSGECPNMTASPSNGSPAKPFPQNANIGTCAPASNAAKFAGQIAQAYERWKANFVQNDHVVAPEQSNRVTSEAMGYGMMIAAAMGDKAAFEKFWGYVNQRLTSGLMGWNNGADGSASDADIDIAYALYMADKQWPGVYQSAGSAMVKAISDQDIEGDVVTGGQNFHQAFNPSYFAPAALRTFGNFDSVIARTYQFVNTNVTGSKGTKGIPTDWGDTSSGAATGPSGQVTSEIQDGSNGAMGYDAARVPWRLGLDACLTSGADKTALKAIVDLFASKYDQGASVDLMKAGWYKKDGLVHPDAKDLQGSYIGPMGVGGMAMGNTVMRDRAFRVLLDILENGDFNHTYFPSTVGLLSVLALSGNFPTP